MGLCSADKLLLLLYFTYFKTEYDINDNRKINIGNNEFLKRHIEMQNISYLTETQNVPLGRIYNHIWNGFSPYSYTLAYYLNELDKNADKITDFYQEFNNKKYKRPFSDSEKLQIISNGILRDYQAEQIMFSSFVLEDIMNSQNGNIIMAGMIYLQKTVLPNANSDDIFKELETRLKRYGIDVDNKDEVLAWRSAIIAGLIPMNKEYLYNNPKELKRLLKP